jgi:hypothetical protein
MPYLAPGVVSYHVATKQVTHGNPCIEDGVAGVAVKQQEQSWTLGIANRQVIAVGESFAIIHQGVVQIPSSLLASAAKGDAVYITPATNALTRNTPPASATNVAYGRVVNVAGDNRGTPTGFIRIDLSARDNII